MTTLAAVWSPETGAIIASDTQITAGHYKQDLPGGKWVVGKKWAIGCAGALRTLNLLQQHQVGLFDDVQTHYDLLERVVVVMRESGYHFAPMNGETGGPFVTGQNFLLASAHGVWSIDDSCAITTPTPGQIIAEGSGHLVAAITGQVLARLTDLSLEERVRESVRNAIIFDAFSGGDVWLHKIGPVQTRSKKMSV